MPKLITEATSYLGPGVLSDDPFVNSYVVFTFQCLSRAILSQTVLWYSPFTDHLINYSSESGIPVTDKI